MNWKERSWDYWILQVWVWYDIQLAGNMWLYYFTIEVRRLKCYLICYPVVLLYTNTSQNDHWHRCVLTYVVLLSSLLHMFSFLILVFHLKQKHEQRERLSHYLQQTNAALATCTFIYAIKQEIFGNEIKCLQSRVFTEAIGCVT
jgi:hypothetical protein